MARAVRVLLTIFGATILSGCFNRTFVVFPELDVQVTDRAGAGLTDASLKFYAWSYPHRRLDAEASYSGDAEGRISSPEEVDSETVAPLLPHGVSEHHWSFCVTVPGYRTLIGSLGDLVSGEALRLILPLTSGESAPVCDDYRGLHTHRGAPRADIAAQNAKLSGVYEVVE